jgi:hypothetical protein
MTELHLLEKTELFVDNIRLNQVNLTRVADAVAAVLGLEADEVAVIDVRSETLALDILKPKVRFDQIAGKRRALFAALQSIPGITLTEKTTLHSEGILGIVNLSEAQVPELAKRVDQTTAGVNEAVQRRAIIFPTGEEIIDGSVADTNTPFLTQILTQAGYRVTAGPALEDSLSQVIYGLRKAVDRGYGLAVTTGGVGAEDKDFAVEAVLALDHGAAAPYIAHYAAGHGRHVKNGVRIAVGRCDWTTFVALPGPHDEVQIAAPILARGMREQWDKSLIAERIAAPLRAKLVHPKLKPKIAN